MICINTPAFLWRYAAVAVSLIFNWSAFAQDILWEKSYGGKHAEYLFDAVPTPDYGFILAGSSLSKKTGTKTEDNRGDLDYWVWKMDEKGEADWQMTFGGKGQDMLHSVLLTNDGGYLLVGSSEASPGPSRGGEPDGDKKNKGYGGMDFWVIKLNAKGGEEWQKTIGGIGQDELNSALRTKDGGYLLAGSSASPPKASPGPSRGGEKTAPCYGGMDYWVVKIDRKGEIVWQNSFGGIYQDELRSIVATDDNGFLLGGSSNSPASPGPSRGRESTGTKTDDPKGQSDYWIVKIDEKGNEQWQKTIGGNGDDELAVAYATSDGNYLLGGNSNSESGDDKRSSNQSGTDFWVLKLDKDANILWQETYNIAKTDVLTSIVENDDKTLLLGGYAQGERRDKGKGIRDKKQLQSEVKMKKGTDDYVAIKINAKGEELWRKDVGSDGQDILIKAVETRDGGYLMAGTSKAQASPPAPLQRRGEQKAAPKASGDRASGIGSTDFWVVKLKDKDKKKVEKSPIEAIPNPAIDYTNVIVGYDFTKGTATVVDLAGRVLQQFPISERTIPIDLSGLPEGVYVVNIKTDKGSDGVKVIKARDKR